MDYILGISGEELHESFSRGNRIVLLDVSSTETTEMGKLPGVIHLPLDRIDDMAEQVLKNKEAEIVAFAGIPGLAVAASVELREKGFSRVRYFKGDARLMSESVFTAVIETLPSQTVAA